MRTTFRIAAAVAFSLALSGCITLMPKTKPVQMYRFGYLPETLDKTALPAVAGLGMAPAPVVLGMINFPQDSSSDRVTTIENSEVSYVASARWTAPAEELFSEAVSEGFARSADSVRLVSRGPSAGDFRLDITVRQFETVYHHGRPTVSVAFDARLIRLSDRAVVGERFITSDIGVGHNDMSLTVDAYNKATTESVAGLIGFTETTMAAQAGVATPSPEQPSDGKQHVEGL